MAGAVLTGLVPLAARAATTADGQPEAAAPQAASDTSSELVVTAARTTRSAVALGGAEVQKILPGVNPLKAIETLPGVLFVTADPWGNDEQNEEVFVHGFTTQQLGYTFDNLPLGDQQYGNYDGLSPSRAVTSENVSKIVVESGAGSLGVASVSNLGGAIETFSNDPGHALGFDVRETLGSYDTTRTFLRVDTGPVFGGAGYVSYLHQDARAWDFDGYQNDDQLNIKYVRSDPHGKLTLYVDYDYKVDPNEDAIAVGNQQTSAAAGFIPYTRPYQYPNLPGEEASLTNAAGINTGTPPTAQGNNFSNYFSAEQREDVLGYAKYDYRIADNLSWSNQVYYHYDYGRGIVAGPVNNAGLPALFVTYFPGLEVGGSTTSLGTLTNLVNIFGGTTGRSRPSIGDSASIRSRPGFGTSTMTRASTGSGIPSRAPPATSRPTTSRTTPRSSPRMRWTSRWTTPSSICRTSGGCSRTSSCRPASSRACRRPAISCS
jgi:hypothetical protein